jgi:hypothetical protein
MEEHGRKEFQLHGLLGMWIEIQMYKEMIQKLFAMGLEYVLESPSFNQVDLIFSYIFMFWSIHN